MAIDKSNRFCRHPLQIYKKVVKTRPICPIRLFALLLPFQFGLGLINSSLRHLWPGLFSSALAVLAASRRRHLRPR